MKNNLFLLLAIVVALGWTGNNIYKLGVEHGKRGIADWEEAYFYEQGRRHLCESALRRAASNCPSQCFTTADETGSLIDTQRLTSVKK